MKFMQLCIIECLCHLKTHLLSPKSQCDDSLLKVITQEGKTLLNGISVFIKEHPGNYTGPSIKWRYQKDGHLLTKKPDLTDTEFTGTLIMDFPLYWTVGNNFLLFISYQCEILF
jgi:hypothetical protein